MPLLFVVGSFYLCCQFWIDKFLCLKYYKEPLKFDGLLSKKIRVIMAFAAVWHLFFAFLMISNDSIFPLVSLIVIFISYRTLRIGQENL
jgi:hypothetical protein